MVPRIAASAVAGLAGLLSLATFAHADGTQFPGTRPLGTGGAMRAVATGDSGPQLNPSGISLMRAYFLEGSYQYGKTADSNDARISAVDSTSGFNIGGALYYTYHRDSPSDGTTQIGHLVGGSLSFPLLDKIFFGANVKYVHFTDATESKHVGFTFDAGLTIRPVPLFSLAAVGYNLRDVGTPWAPRAVGGGVALLPTPVLLFVFDAVLEKVYGEATRDQAYYFMGGGEFSFASSAAIRAGGGHDGLTKNGYVSAGISVLSADVGSIDLGLRQDISGSRKATMVGISARLFVPSM
jgi:hypothetical protein